MKSKTLKLILETVAQIVNITRGLNINKEAIDTHSTNLTIARKRMDKYMEQYKNAEYMKTLSPPEQQNLSKNANAVYEVHEKLRKEIDYLDMNKQPYFVAKAIVVLDSAYLLIEYIYKELVGESGEITVPHLKCIQLKNVDKATYKQMVTSLQLELDGFIHDMWLDHQSEFHPLFYTAYGHLAEAYMWMKKEEERLKVEAIPETEKILVPEETPLELPKAPEDSELPGIPGTVPPEQE